MKRSFKTSLPVILNSAFTGAGISILFMPPETLAMGWRIAVAVAWMFSIGLTAYTARQAGITSVSAAGRSDVKTD